VSSRLTTETLLTAPSSPLRPSLYRLELEPTSTYVAYEEPGFPAYFGSFASTPPIYTAGPVLLLSINDDDDVVVFYKEGFAVDIFSVVGKDGSGKPLEYLDGWTYSGPREVLTENSYRDGSVYRNVFDGIFVFTDDTDPEDSTGVYIRVTGTVSERFGESQISGSTLEAWSVVNRSRPSLLLTRPSTAPTPKPLNVCSSPLPRADCDRDLQLDFLWLDTTLLVRQVLPAQPTSRYLPTSVEAADLAPTNTAHSVVLDDDSNNQNRLPSPYVSPSSCL